MRTDFSPILSARRSGTLSDLISDHRPKKQKLPGNKLAADGLSARCRKGNHAGCESWKSCKCECGHGLRG